MIHSMEKESCWTAAVKANSLFVAKEGGNRKEYVLGIRNPNTLFFCVAGCVGWKKVPLLTLSSPSRGVFVGIEHNENLMIHSMEKESCWTAAVKRTAYLLPKKEEIGKGASWDLECKYTFLGEKPLN
ncbi:hypothetical protein CEXT_221801 [Caerostris extrusa]|uniref:Uncharacterized protein n=1 Tax=Caerostris extrusa TaxID=172846 RepID=A0AAV4MB16_CAEEX|nr:hypothetical protein CEXT_221801 [Caerostris extrusa]